MTAVWRCKENRCGSTSHVHAACHPISRLNPHRSARWPARAAHTVTVISRNSYLYRSNNYGSSTSQRSSYGENIRFTGDVPLAQMPCFYDRSRIYVSTSFYEGLPGTCLEAMAMGLPVVAWDLGFYSGLAKDGITGYLVPPNDLDTMSSRVLQLLDNAETAASLGCNGRAVVLDRYEWQTIAKMVLAQLQ